MRFPLLLANPIVGGPLMFNLARLTQVRIESLAGLTVALALVQEAVAFAFVVGVHTLVGL